MSEKDMLLEARNITIWRGENLIVDNISVQVPKSSIVQIQGSNGSGKTTLLRALVGLAEVDEGEVFWKGESALSSRDEMYLSLLYLGHKPGITAGLTPYENLMALCPELSEDDHSKDRVRQNILESLSELGIADRIDLPSVALSAGQQRRVALARLKLQVATLWVLDEPLTSLDANGQQWVKAAIQRHVGEGGSVIFTTHQPIVFDDMPVKTVLLTIES